MFPPFSTLLEAKVVLVTHNLQRRLFQQWSYKVSCWTNPNVHIQVSFFTRGFLSVCSCWMNVIQVMPWSRCSKRKKWARRFWFAVSCQLWRNWVNIWTHLRRLVPDIRPSGSFLPPYLRSGGRGPDILTLSHSLRFTNISLEFFQMREAAALPWASPGDGDTRKHYNHPSHVLFHQLKLVKFMSWL